MTQPGGPLPLLPGGPAPLYPSVAPTVSPGVPATDPRYEAEDAELQRELAEVRAHDEHSARLEAEHGKLGVFASQYARGVLDAVMSPAALVAVPTESAGYLTGWKGMEDFGRDFGRAAQGGELINAYMSLSGGLGTKEALTDYERSQKTLQEQEEAWPMLSAVSHVGGAVTAGLVTGGLASGHAGLGTMTAAGAYEGAAYGAQAGYAKNASLRDVATSALIGAAVGGGLTFGVGKGAELLRKRADRAAHLREAFGTADDAAARAGVTVEEAGGREAQSVIGELAKARKAALKAADAVDNPGLKEQATAAATEEAAEILARKAGKFEPASWTAKDPSPIQKVVYRRQILDHVSDDVATATKRIDELRPTLDVPLDKGRLAKLMSSEGTDAPAAIGKLQSRVGELMGELPHSAQGDALRLTLRDASSRLMKADLPTAMKDAHELVRTLGKVSLSETDDLTRSYAQRAAQSLADDMTGEAFGDAGKLYGQLVAGPGKGFSELGDKVMVREALRTMMARGQLPDIVRAEANAIAAAQDAASKLTGKAGAKGVAAELRAVERLTEKAESAVTLDGGPVGRVFDWFKDKATSKVAGAIGAGVGGVIGGWPGAIAGNVVANAVRSRIGPVLGMLKQLGSLHVPGKHLISHAAQHAAKEKAQLGATAAYLSTGQHNKLSAKEKHEQNQERSDALEEFAAETEHPQLAEGVQEIERILPGMGGEASAGAQERFATLRNDWIRPQPSIRGKAYEVLSSEDLRKNHGMWEATVDPMSVYDDLARGRLDYDKLNYTWKQYPGLLTASQMAVVDMVHSHLNDDERGNVPEHVLAQLDLAFQMQGGLSKSLDRGWAKRIDQANQQLMAEQSQKPRPQGMLNLPGAKPTPVTRIAGNV